MKGKSTMIIKRKDYSIELSEPILYVDNEKRRRSGHMTHGLAEFAPGKLIDFNSNCAYDRCEGHSTFGWVEYRISEDGGETFSPVYDLEYSKQVLLEGVYVISVEKAVACDDGTIIAFCLRSDNRNLCVPWATPMYIRSFDGGKTWSEAKELCGYRGRMYDACYHNGTAYVLMISNDGEWNFCGHKEEHLYRLYKSDNNGESFEELCVVPIPWLGRGYGSMLFDDTGRLHVYAYNENDERAMDHVVSEDGGIRWVEPDVCYLAKGIRNPQTALIDGVYILHGRAEKESGFVLYSSKDGQNWDEGTYIGEVKGVCYYSNNIVLKDKDDKNRLLIQYSEIYIPSRVNVMHRWLTIHR